MDFHSITDPYIPSWAKSEAQGTASLFDCNEQQPMENNPFDGNEQQPIESNYSNANNENMQAFADLNNEQQPMENNYPNTNNENMQAFSGLNNGGDAPLEGNNFFDDNVPVVEDSNLLWPVSPFEAGEGLPYAPIDWPNPGDTWTWRVGRRVNSAGYFQDRFLYPPKHIVPPGEPKYFASKAACENFVKTNFPGADVTAFFASFSWKILGKAPPKVEPTPAPMAETSEAKLGTAEENKDQPTPRYSKRERKQKIEKAEVEEKPGEPKAKVSRSSTPRKRKQAGETSSVTTPAATAQRKSRGSSRRGSRVAPGHDEHQEEAMVNLIPEDFDNYLNSLDDMLGQPIAAEPQFPASLFEDSSVPNDEMVKARNKLSSLLQKDFHLWLSSKNFSQLTTLASKIRQDPTLTADQLVKLKLIDELPLFSEVYSESRQAIHQVDKFFTTLDGNKNKVASMKHEYGELKEKADQLQSLVDSSLMAVKDIDDQIAQLKARRAELTKTVETNKAAKVELSFSQKMVASSIPGVVNDIQVANSKISEMEMKKVNAQKREYEILEKFAPLKGFTM